MECSSNVGAGIAVGDGVGAGITAGFGAETGDGVTVVEVSEAVSGGAGVGGAGVGAEGTAIQLICQFQLLASEAVIPDRAT